MSGSGRKRSSKWDLREERHFESEWPGKAGTPFHDKELESGWLSPEVAGGNNSKWSEVEFKRDVGLASGEPLPRSRGSVKDNSFSKGRNRNLEATVAWDEDESYSEKMSPGLGEWRRQSRSHSPKNGWSRSLRGRSRSRSRSRGRSRSPIHGVRRESGFRDRSRSRGASTQLCRDFTAGRCRRGSHCHFLHQDNQHYEDSWESRHGKDGDSKYSSSHDTRDYTSKMGRSTSYCTDFIRGKCQRGASCRYAHDGASDGFSKVYGNDVIRERENHRNRDASFERGGEAEDRRNDVPCKFFAAGNCRNGKYCRFSHHSRAGASPDGRSRDDRPRDDRWHQGHNSDDADGPVDGPKLSEWSEAVTVSTALKSENKNAKLTAPEPRFTGWSMDDTRWGHCLDKEKKTGGDPAVGPEVVESNEEAGHLWMKEHAGAGMGVSEPRGADKWLGDMSPDWKYGVQSMNHVVKEERGHNSPASQSLGSYDTSLVTKGQDINREASVRMHDAAAVRQPTLAEKSYFQRNCNVMADGAVTAVVLPCEDKSAIDKTVSSCADLNFPTNITPRQCFDLNVQSSSSLPLPNMNAVGQNQVAANAPPTMKHHQNIAASPEGKSLVKQDIGNASSLKVNPGGAPSQNMVSSEQLSKLTNLSASLAQFFEDRQQLPQLYAALNSRNSLEIPSFAHCEASLQPVLTAAVKAAPAIGSQQYDPICDSIESKKLETGMNPAGFSPNPTVQKSSLDGNPEIPLKNLSLSSFSGVPNVCDFHRTGSSEEPNHKNHQSNQLETGENRDALMENSKVGAADESNKAQERNRKEQEDGLVRNADRDAGEDEGKKSKDMKGFRAFKFALVEFVKELLKPSWKEGQIGKDAYKTIVKKVVDKVTGTMQGANIPQTQEKIDHYLSSSRPKLTKLVQAYVEKSQKG